MRQHESPWLVKLHNAFYEDAKAALTTYYLLRTHCFLLMYYSLLNDYYFFEGVTANTIARCTLRTTNCTLYTV